MEGGGKPAVARADVDAVGGSLSNMHGVGEPFAGLEVVHDVAAAGGVGGGDDVDVFARPVLASGVALDVVVVGDAFSPAIEILRLERAGDRYGRAGIGRLGCGRHARSKKKRNRGNE